MVDRVYLISTKLSIRWFHKERCFSLANFGVHSTSVIDKGRQQFSFCSCRISGCLPSLLHWLSRLSQCKVVPWHWPWPLHPGSRWMPNMLIGSETGSEWWTILGHPPLIECMGICVLSLAHGYELRGFDVYQSIVKKKIIRKIQPGYVLLHGHCLEFFRDFSK